MPEQQEMNVLIGAIEDLIEAGTHQPYCNVWAQIPQECSCDWDEAVGDAWDALELAKLNS
jgi:hypothetical protein